MGYQQDKECTPAYNFYYSDCILKSRMVFLKPMIRSSQSSASDFGKERISTKSDYHFSR